MTGHVFDIKKFAVHDGPGIRSTVFLKGCPLKCQWCQNPEGISTDKHLWYFENRCIKCHKCIPVCPQKALSVSGDSPHIVVDKSLCDNCGACVDVCPTEALNFDSSSRTVDEVVETLLDDSVFYRRSGGGITISGGDPMQQHKFALEILKRCRKEGLHTAIETSMFASGEVFRRFIPYVDFFIVDLKLMDPEAHKTYIGTHNALIHENFKALAASGKEMLVRTPLIPGITATPENIRSVARFIYSQNPAIPLELINYNPFADNKYRLMGENYSLAGTKPLTKDELEDLYAIIKEEGIQPIRETEI